MSDSPPKIRPIDADAQPKSAPEPEGINIPSPDDAPKVRRRGDDRKLHEALNRFYATVGGGVASAGMFTGNLGLVVSGTNVATRAEEAADAWMELADTNPKVKKFLESFMEGSSIANLIAAHLSMVVPVIAAQGMIPGEVANFFLTDEAKAAGAQFAAMAATQQNGTGPSGG